MQTEWLTEKYRYERIVLAVDVGGTNSRIAIVGQNNEKFSIVVKSILKTAEITNFTECLKGVLTNIQIKVPGLRPNLCCIGAAGPVENDHCEITNVPWPIDRQKIENTLGIKTYLINDLSAISYGVALLDVNDSKQIIKLQHSDGTYGVQRGNIRAVTGAGTGMGVGFLLENNGKFKALASEAGHTGFSPFDTETKELRQYFTSRFGDLMETELFISGRGIINIFNYFRDAKKIVFDEILTQIDKAEDSQKPELISKYADENPVCKKVMKLFVKLYGRFTGDIATAILPTMGMYITGGIVVKNEKFFVENNQFMKYFDSCFNPHIRAVLITIPVYIVRDSSVSLYGAAYAGCSLLE